MARLRDGSEVTIRKLTPRDAPVLAEAFERLSPQSRDLRFLSAKPRLSSNDLQYLTDVDGHLHEALGAVDKATGRGVGVARFVRLDADAPVAEVAVTVVDDWQRRGLGTLLLERLSERARAEGIERYTALVSGENRAIVGLLDAHRRARAQRQRRCGHGRIRSRGARRSGSATACAGRFARRPAGR